MSYFTASTSLSEVSRRFITSMSNSGSSKSRSASIAVGRVIASYFPVPTQDITQDVPMYWRANNSIKASAMFDCLNEIALHDRQACLKYAEIFFSHKAHSANLRGSAYGVGGSEHQLYHFFGLTQYFDIDTLNHISNNQDDLTVLCGGYSSVFKDLSKAE